MTPPAITPLSEWTCGGDDNGGRIGDAEAEIEIDDDDDDDEEDAITVEEPRFVTAVDSGLVFARAGSMSKRFSVVILRYAHPGTAVAADIGSGILKINVY